ncbi:protein-L-isoaspartate O-methyltransferase family protein [Pararhodobacter sp.]|uniref:protein-L-isoaspartate O-methyltransferase family protein n=1 Tax=Pararhodobacter sp. TaxID=2127056 RepID=UPI002FDE009B
MTDFAARRIMMVDTQVRPSDVTKFPIIEAMLAIPREQFVPASMMEAAYVGETLEIAPGRVLLEARTLAKMLDALDLRANELVLDLGAGLGYSSAVMAQLAEAVIAVEPIESLADDAEAALEAVGASNVVVERLMPAEGAPRHGPYDVIVVQGGVEQFPEALADQLKEGGRTAAIFMDRALGVVRIGVKRQGVIRWRDAFNAAAPVLDGFAKERAFAL